jgi:hypothetical protein
VILEATIQHLREYCPPLAGRVAGAADFRLGLQNYNTNMVLPSGYVVPLDQESPGFKSLTGIWQNVTMVYGVIVEFDAQTDRRGQTPAMQYDTMQKALWAAMLGWVPEECRSPNQAGFWFSGGRFLDLDRARLFYQYEFAMLYQLNDEDGWQGDPGEQLDLEELWLDIHKAPLEEHPDPAVVTRIIPPPPRWTGRNNR